jgi:hypothetical protein
MADMEEKGPEKGEAYGTASITNALAGLDFPASKEEVLEHARQNGKEQIYWTKDHSIDLKQVLDASGKDRFEGMSELVSLVGEEARKGEVVS